MLGQVRSALAARVAAALVAVALSGAPRAVALHAPVKRHVCTCRTQAGMHRMCTCVFCRLLARSARNGGEGRPGAEDGQAAGAPCIQGTCGDGSQPSTVAGGAEPFCLASRTLPAPILAEEPQPVRPSVAAERSLEPETPPPRPA